MISQGGMTEIDDLSREEFDLLIFGLGFESRSTFVSSKIRAKKTIALKLPRIDIHSYRKNLSYAETRNYVVYDGYEKFCKSVLPTIIDRAKKPISIVFDISSVNRFMLFEVILTLMNICRYNDKLTIMYCPAKFAAPNRNFPQIEQIGPISGHFSSYDADATKPLCLMIGLGFEPGVAMGIISQLEPRLSYCFWGSGIDSRFDLAVKKANFDFDFSGFATRDVRYLLSDPKGSFELLESITYGLLADYNIVLAPLGPKIFSLVSALLGYKYLGRMAIWRVQQNRINSLDSLPQNKIVFANIDLEAVEAAKAGREVQFATA